MRLSAALLILVVCGCGPTTDITRRPRHLDGGVDGGDESSLDLSANVSTDMAVLRDRDAACAAVTAEATLIKKPVDIIFVIDNSGSMGDEIADVVKNVNVNFAQIIGRSGLDYRVIMLSWYATADGGGYYRVCVKAPLGGNVTCLEPKPINTATFFHFNQRIDSNDSFNRILDTYNKRDPSCDPAPAACSAANGWSDWLRPESVKIFVEITDDRMYSLTGAQFDSMLFALTPKMFGDATNRNYVWYSIIGIQEKAGMPTAPYTASQLPAAGTESNCCSTAYAQGFEYQLLTKLTGGLAFPICQHANFDVVFNAIAQGVVRSAGVACEFEIPPPPNANGEVVDLSSVLVTYTPGNGGLPATFKQVTSLAACEPAAFYIDSGTDPDMGAGKIVLCPDTCTAVKADTMAKMSVTFDCSTIVM
jgi:hypothetical protein